jgi:hypothetical protein
MYRVGEFINLTESEDYEKWERPPSTFEMQVNNWSFSLLTLHSRPDDTPSELDHLDDYAGVIEGEVIVLGDMNMDKSYYYGDPEVFTNWTWAISDGCDTNIASGNKCYDRMFLNKGVDNFIASGIYKDIEWDYKDIDHYMIYGVFEV